MGIQWTALVGYINIKSYFSKASNSKFEYYLKIPAFGDFPLDESFKEHLASNQNEELRAKK